MRIYEECKTIAKSYSMMDFKDWMFEVAVASKGISSLFPTTISLK